MNRYDRSKTYGPAEILEMAMELAGQEGDLRSRTPRDRETFKTFVRRKLKKMGTRDENGRYRTSWEGAMFLIKDNQEYFDYHFPPKRSEEEADAILEARERALSTVREDYRIEHDDLTTDELLALEAAIDVGWPDGVWKKTTFSEEEKIRIMISALFYHLYPGFDFKALNAEYDELQAIYAKQEQYRGLTDITIRTELQMEADKLAPRVFGAINGTNMSAYLTDTKKGSANDGSGMDR